MRAVRRSSANDGSAEPRAAATPARGPAPAHARGHGHKHTAPGQHEHEFEPQHGLPEVLPAGEKLLWQGSPDWKMLAVHRFHIRTLSIYFALMLAARIGSDMVGGQTFSQAMGGAMVLVALSVLCLGGIALIAWMSATNTVYTLTDKRVVMRIGIVLTLSLNLPLKRMSGAALAVIGRGGSGNGDIALQLRGPDRIAYLHLWPHARRWRFTRPEPTLLCVPQAAAVAAQLTAAWQAVEAQGATSVSAQTPAEVVSGTATTAHEGVQQADQTAAQGSLHAPHQPVPSLSLR